MLYANLDEVYPVKSIKKSVKSVKSVKSSKKSKKKEEDNNIQAFNDVNDNGLLAYPASEYESTVPLYKTVNHCNPLEAPPYKFPVSDEALDKFNEALDVMDNVEDSQNLDEYDTYLEENVIPEEESKIIRHVPKRVKKEKDEGSKQYELLLFIAIGLILIFMCEVIARIAISRG